MSFRHSIYHSPTSRSLSSPFRLAVLQNPRRHVRTVIPYNPNLPRPTFKHSTSPFIEPSLPPGFTFYDNHNDYPVIPVPDLSKMYQDPRTPPPLPRTSVFHYLFPPKRKGEHLRYYPEPDPRVIAYIDGLTGRELYRHHIPVQAMWLATGLARLGLKRGDVMGLFGMNSLDWIEGCMGGQALNLIVSPINYAYTPEEVLYQLMDSGAKAIMVQPDLVPVLEKALALAPPEYTLPESRILLLCQYDDKPAGTPYKCLQEIWDKQRVPRQLQGMEEKETAYLCYSSGTTGRAKGVETSHHNITSQIQAVNMSYEPLGVNDRVLGILPFGHIYGLTLLCHQPMTRGSPVVVLPKFDVETVLRTIQNYRITWALVVPPMLIALINSPLWDKYDLSSLKGVQTGAAPCSAELIAAFEGKFPKVKVRVGYGQPAKYVSQCTVTQGYGLTETSPVTHVMTIKEGLEHRGKIGRIIPTMQARIVDPDTGEDMPTGERGELWLRGTSVMKGYWRNPEATNNAFAPGGWFKTGDIATVDEQGYFAIVDRVKELIKYKGYQVPPAELEALLLTHPKVADVGVIGVYSESQATELPRAYIVPQGGLDAVKPAARAALAKEISDWVTGKVSGHKKLRGGVVFLDAIPKSPSGKILRKVLRDQAKQEQEDEVKKSRESKL
ncbi:AMP binding protein [Papiliotrema laurentii]|uniref:AMP binding protein n=1 Tax=Papiliotrema laurentii TaxID=5418 RepID=A0AAD9FTH9_PAPLA|nr:AMP binding protein [Papiliotrema laurentii]